MSHTQREFSILHTPDFLVIQADEAGWVECKPLEKLEQLAVSTPGRYTKDETGRWRCPPGESVAAEKGFFYRVWSPTERDQILVRNFRFLHDPLHFQPYLIPIAERFSAYLLFHCLYGIQELRARIKELLLTFFGELETQAQRALDCYAAIPEVGIVEDLTIAGWFEYAVFTS